MGKKLKTIYEYFCGYSEEEIDKMIHGLSIEEKLLIRDRYGNDLHNPSTLESWTNEKSLKFYGTLVDKMRRLLQKSRKVEQSQDKQANVEVVETTRQEEKNTFQVLQPIPLLPQLLKLINDGKSNKEICANLNLTPQQLCKLLLKLKNMGLMVSKRYYSDGSIGYKQVTAMQELRYLKALHQDRTIITDTHENQLKFLVISDLHFGHQLERLDLIDRAYNYCIKNGINIILCGGDLIDGAYSKGEQRITDLYQQIDYFIKNYPFDKNILTFSVAGNHDISAFNKASLNIIDMCDNYRQDIIIGGYNNMGIHLKNDQILLYHHIDGGVIRQTDSPIILHGHSHKYTTTVKNNSLEVTIPSLSEICQPMPSALELNLFFDKGYIVNSKIKHVYFDTEDIVLGESTFDLRKNRGTSNEMIRNVELYKQPSTSKEGNTLVKKLQPLSQIEKFNKKYGNNIQ